jgi:DNA processing protein
MDQRERDAWLLIGLLPGLGSVLTRRCIEYFGSPLRLLSGRADEFCRVEGVSNKKAVELADAIRRFAGSQELNKEIQAFERLGASLVAMGTPAYPKSLALIQDPPVVLYVRGQLREEDALSIAIVGSRRCSRYGIEQADRFSSLLCQSGLVIVSGGALGIDTAAHRATLRVKGRTIAVLGSGLARPYPTDNIQLFDQIVENGGAVISELPMLAPPMRENFPNRNRIISGLSLGVVVIEAEVRSGALITARLCAEDHGRYAMAVPGPVDSPTSAGCHKILREGWASLVTRHTDVLDSLGEAGTLLQAGMEQAAQTADPSDDSGSLFSPGAANSILATDDPLERGLTPSQRKIMHALDQPRLPDQISSLSGLAIHTIQADLTLLEIRGMIQKNGAQFSRRRKT